jgi:hypothetical protein
MSKFVGKFRKNENYADDFEYTKNTRKKSGAKHKIKEHAEIKKKMRQWEYENHSRIYESDY